MRNLPQAETANDDDPMMAINYQSAQEANAWSKAQRDVIQSIRMIQYIHRVLQNNKRRMIRDIIQSSQFQCSTRAITLVDVEKLCTLYTLCTTIK